MRISTNIRDFSVWCVLLAVYDNQPIHYEVWLDVYDEHPIPANTENNWDGVWRGMGRALADMCMTIAGHRAELWPDTAPTSGWALMMDI